MGCVARKLGDFDLGAQFNLVQNFNQARVGRVGAARINHLGQLHQLFFRNAAFQNLQTQRIKPIKNIGRALLCLLAALRCIINTLQTDQLINRHDLRRLRGRRSFGHIVSTHRIGERRFIDAARFFRAADFSGISDAAWAFDFHILKIITRADSGQPYFGCDRVIRWAIFAGFDSPFSKKSPKAL